VHISNYNGKLLLDKNIVIDLKNSYGSRDNLKNFETEEFKGSIDSLKFLLKNKCEITNEFFRKEGDNFFFLKNDKEDWNNHEDGDLKVTVKFVIYFLLPF